MKTSTCIIVSLFLAFCPSVFSQQAQYEIINDNLVDIHYVPGLKYPGSEVIRFFIPPGKEFGDLRLKGFSIGESYLVSGRLSVQFIDTIQIKKLRNQQILQVFTDPLIRLGEGREINISSMELELSLKDGPNNEKYLKSGIWKQLISSFVINPEMIPRQVADGTSMDDDGAEYIIIGPEVFEQQMEALKTWRLCEGIVTEIYNTSETGSTAQEISDFISNAYLTWTIPPGAVLLVGDHELVPAPVWNNYCLSDNKYADVDGDDLPDMLMSRLPVSDATELDTYLTRIFDFETNPPEDSSFYAHPLAATSFQNPASGSWMVTEILNGWYQNEMQKEPVRLYDGSSAPFEWPDEELFAVFGPDGLNYIPESPDYLGNYGGGNATMMNAALNSGAMSWFVYTQGSATGWGAPEYQISDLSGLDDALPSFLISVSSLTGDFGVGDCIAEAYLLHPDGGTGVIAPSEIIYNFAAQWFTIGLLDGLWDDFLPGFATRFLPDNVYLSHANVSAKLFLEMYPSSINPSVKQTFYHVFHHFGAPFVPVFDDVPQEISMLHGEHIFPGQTAFEVQADSGAVVSLMMDGQINAVMMSTGGTLVLPLFNPQEGDTLHVTATRHNHKRYQAQVICSQYSNLEGSLQDFDVKLTPNPATGFFDVVFPGRVSSISSFQMLDVFGNRVETVRAAQVGGDRIRVDVSGLKSGIYIIKLETLNQEITRRILILR